MATKANGKTEKIERSFKGLRDALFDEFDSLRGGKIKPERANAAARLASEITKSVSCQTDLLRLLGKSGSNGDTESVARTLLR